MASGPAIDVRRADIDDDRLNADSRPAADRESKRRRLGVECQTDVLCGPAVMDTGGSVPGRNRHRSPVSRTDRLDRLALRLKCL
jgi:hypothetical protein